jgi:hypothetical protein
VTLYLPSDRDERTGKPIAGSGVRVYLDNVDVTDDCRACDDEAGWVILMRGTPGNRVVFYEDGQMVLATDTLQGNVKVVLPRGYESGVVDVLERKQEDTWRRD